MALAYVMRGLAPVAKVRVDHNWADVREAKRLPRERLMQWLERCALLVRNRAVEREAPHDRGAGVSWINTTTDDTACAAYVGIMPGPGTKVGVPRYMGKIERGITPHKVSLKHYGARKWFARTFGESEAKPSSRGFYRSVMVWKSLGTFKGRRRERIGVRTAIPWLSRAVKHETPKMVAELRKIARKP